MYTQRNRRAPSASGFGSKEREGRRESALRTERGGREGRAPYAHNKREGGDLAIDGDPGDPLLGGPEGSCLERVGDEQLQERSGKVEGRGRGYSQ